MDMRREVLKRFVDDRRETSEAGGKVWWWLFGRWLAFLRSCVVLMRFERVYNEGLPKGFIRFMISFKCILSYSIVSFA